MFGNNYRNNGNMFYSGLLLGAISGMVATIWFLGTDNRHKGFDMRDHTDQKIGNLDNKEKDRMFNKFIDPNEDESDLLNEFTKSNLTN